MVSITIGIFQVTLNNNINYLPLGFLIYLIHRSYDIAEDNLDSYGNVIFPFSYHTIYISPPLASYFILSNSFEICDK